MSAHVDSTAVESTKTVDYPVDLTAMFCCWFNHQINRSWNIQHLSVDLLLKQPQLNQPKTMCRPMSIQLAISTRKWLIYLHFNSPNNSDGPQAILNATASQPGTPLIYTLGTAFSFIFSSFQLAKLNLEAWSRGSSRLREFTSLTAKDWVRMWVPELPVCKNF